MAYKRILKLQTNDTELLYPSNQLVLLLLLIFIVCQTSLQRWTPSLKPSQKIFMSGVRKPRYLAILTSRAAEP